MFFPHLPFCLPSNAPYAFGLFEKPQQIRVFLSYSYLFFLLLVIVLHILPLMSFWPESYG